VAATRPLSAWRRRTSARSFGQLVKPYSPGDGELGGGPRLLFGHRADAAHRLFAVGRGSAQKITGLAAQLVKIGTAGKRGHTQLDARPRCQA
jgi:hypothetical protein